MAGKFIPNPLMRQAWQADPEANAMIDRVGEDVAEAARGNAPVDTGALRDSIQSQASEEGGAEPSADIVADVPYAAFVEFGTYKDAAQPFLRPALDEVVG